MTSTGQRLKLHTGLVAVGRGVPPPQIDDAAKPIQARVDITGIGIVGAGQADQCVPQFGLQAVLLNDGFQPQIAVVGQVRTGNVRVDQARDPTTEIVDGRAHAVIIRQLATVGR